MHGSGQDALTRELTKGAGGAPSTRAAAGPRRKKAGTRRRRGSAAAVSEDQLLGAIRQHEGERTEVIAKALGVTSKDLKPTLDGLVDAGTVTRKGKARGTTLHLGKGGASPQRARKTRKKAARKTSRKKAGRRKKTSRRKTRAS